MAHVGSAHIEQEWAALLTAGQQRIAEMTETQMQLHLGLEGSQDTVPAAANRQVVGSASRWLVDSIQTSYEQLGFSDQVDDDAFFLMVLDRFVEPPSKTGSLRVLDELGVDTVHHNTLLNGLNRAQQRDCRGRIAQACFDYSVATTGRSILL